MSMCMQPEQKLANALVAYTESFDELASPHRTIQQVKQASAAPVGRKATSPRPIRNGVEAARFSSRRDMPSFCLITFGKSELSQLAQRRHNLREAELCLYGDFRLTVPAAAERAQAGGLRLGEEKTSGPSHAAGASG